MNLSRTDGGLSLDSRPTRQLRDLLDALTTLPDQRHFLDAVASMHPFTGDPLRTQALELREALTTAQRLAAALQAAIPAPYTPPAPTLYAEPLPIPARESEKPVDYEWWEHKDNPGEPQ